MRARTGLAQRDSGQVLASADGLEETLGLLRGGLARQHGRADVVHAEADGREGQPVANSSQTLASPLRPMPSLQRLSAPPGLCPRQEPCRLGQRGDYCRANGRPRAPNRGSRAMKPKLERAYTAELQQAREGEARDQLDTAWRHLERAHILSQLQAGPHVLVHVRMLAFGWRRGDRREVLGQLVRVIVAAPGSWLGRAPLGNTGGANVGILTPMPIPEDLAMIVRAEA
ncbi:MAG: hypothetical protein JWN48_1862 [Myxococcaceae bacterium]|nr:hypothetical protein [Myxococcaceae bacterium]